MKEPYQFSLAVALAKLTEALLRIALVIVLAIPVVAVAIIGAAIKPLRPVSEAVTSFYAKLALPFD